MRIIHKYSIKKYTHMNLSRCKNKLINELRKIVSDLLAMFYNISNSVTLLYY